MKALETRTMRRTNALRLFVPAIPRPGPREILQVAWVCQETGEIEWQDIPTVYERAALTDAERKEK